MSFIELLWVGVHAVGRRWRDVRSLPTAVLALVLTLHAFDPLPPPAARIVPTLAVAAPRPPRRYADAAAAAGGTDAGLHARELAPDEAGAAPLPSYGSEPREGARRVRPGTVVGASLGILATDVACVALLGLALAHSCFLEDCESPAWVGPVAALSMVGVVFGPPAGGVVGARRAGERGDAPARAYWLGLGARVGALVAVGLVASRGAPEAALPLVVATELVLTPYVIARVLANAPPAREAYPVRDPAHAPR